WTDKGEIDPAISQDAGSGREIRIAPDRDTQGILDADSIFSSLTALTAKVLRKDDLLPWKAVAQLANTAQPGRLHLRGRAAGPSILQPLPLCARLAPSLGWPLCPRREGLEAQRGGSLARLHLLGEQAKRREEVGGPRREGTGTPYG